MLQVKARDREGNHASVPVSLQSRPGSDQVLLRAERAIYRAGERIHMQIFSTRPGGSAYLDVVKDGQTIATHDLPTVGGFLSGEHVRVRAGLGLLGRPVAEEEAAARADREALLDLLKAEGLADEDPVLALHELLARTPCRLVLASPYDVLGEVRQPNLPGTFDEYPNWRIPLPVPLEDFLRDPRTAAVVNILRRVRAKAGGSGGQCTGGVKE